MDGEIWLRGAQLAPPLGLAGDRRVREVYDRNSDEFGDAETRLITLPSEGGPQVVRVFSLRGARMLGLLARTEPAKAFRRWILDVLDGKVPRKPVPASGPVVILDPAENPLLTAALNKLRQARAITAKAQAETKALRLEAARLASTAGVPGDVLKLIWKREKEGERRISRQPSLPLLEG